MSHRPTERGQALILIVFAAIALFAFAALAIDGSRVFSDRRHAQNAADTAALAAALAKIRADGDDAFKLQAAVDAGKDRALSNGFEDGVNSSVEVHQCDEVGLNPACEALPSGADPKEYLQVVIRFTTPTTFARIIGRDQVPTTVTAIARAKIGTPGGSNGLDAVSALDPSGYNAMNGVGNFSLDINGGGIFVNSTAEEGCPNKNALWFTGTGSYNADTGYKVVGGACPQVPSVTGSFLDGTALPYPPSFSIPTPTFSCAEEGVGTITGNPFVGYTITKGSHPATNLPGGTVTFEAGDHCFPDGFKMTGGNFTADNVNLQVGGTGFDFSSNGSFNCSNTLVHVIAGGVRISGNTTNTCNGVTFFVSQGELSWGGVPTNNFSAPASGTYQGLLVYLPVGNGSGVKIEGNSGSSFSGSIIAASSEISIGGNSSTGTILNLTSQIIGFRVKVTGNGTYNINYDPSKMYAQGEPTMIQLTK